MEGKTITMTIREEEMKEETTEEADQRKDKHQEKDNHQEKDEHQEKDKHQKKKKQGKKEDAHHPMIEEDPHQKRLSKEMGAGNVETSHIKCQNAEDIPFIVNRNATSAI